MLGSEKQGSPVHEERAEKAEVSDHTSLHRTFIGPS